MTAGSGDDSRATALDAAGETSAVQAVILAGGLGTRLGLLTRDTPKPLIPVRGRPYLEYQLRWLRRLGLRQVLLLTGYLGEQVEQRFGDGSGLGMQLEYSQEPRPLGTGGALKLARDRLESAFLVIYGDSFLPIDLCKTAERLADSGAKGLLVAYDNRIQDTSVPSNVALDGEGRFVARYAKEQGDPDLTHVEAGVLAFRRSVLSLFPSAEETGTGATFSRWAAVASSWAISSTSM